MKMGERGAIEFINQCDEGHVLLASLMLIFLLGIVGMTSLHLAGQDRPGISSMKEDNVAQQLADGAADVVMSWFHDSSVTPTTLAGLLAKRQGALRVGHRFSTKPDVHSLSGPPTIPTSCLMRQTRRTIRRSTIRPAVSPNALGGLGRILTLKVYGPLQPGLLSTVEVTATTVDRRPVARTVQLQLGAVIDSRGSRGGASRTDSRSHAARRRISRHGPLGRSTGIRRSCGAASRGPCPQAR